MARNLTIIKTFRMAPKEGIEICDVSSITEDFLFLNLDAPPHIEFEEPFSTEENFIQGYMCLQDVYEDLEGVQSFDYEIYELICEDAITWYWGHLQCLEYVLNISPLNTLQIVWLYRNRNNFKIDSPIYNWEQNIVQFSL